MLFESSLLPGKNAIGIMVFLLSLLLLTPLSSVVAEERAMYQVDATNSGFYSGTSSNFTYSPIPIWEEITSFTPYSNPILIDINGDSVKDIIYGGAHGQLKALGGDYSLLWEFNTAAAELSTPAAADIDKDGHIEVVFVANEEEPKLYCVSYKGVEKWNFTLPSFSEESFPTIAEVTNNFGLEILISAGQTSLGIGTSTSLFCIDSDGKKLWDFVSSELFYEVTSSPVVADISGDSAPEIIFGVTGNAGVFVLDNLGNKIWSKTPGFRYSTPITYNIDNSGRPEVIIGVDSALYCYNSDGGELWHSDLSEPVFSTPFARDIDGDGNVEVLAASDFLYCFYANGTLRWKQPLKEKVHYSSIAFGDINSGLGEILIGDINGTLYSFSGNGDLNWEVQYGTKLQSSPVIADVNGDGTPELFLTMQRGDYVITSFLDLPLSSITPMFDFELGMVSMQPAIPVDSHETTYSMEIFNRGNVFSSTDVILVIDNATVDSEFIAIPPGYSVDVSLEWIAETGDHHAEVMVDPYHNVDEIREDNNKFTSDFTVIPEFIDLVIENEDITMTQLEDPVYYRLTVRIQNIGNLPSGNFSMRMTINGEEETFTDIFIDPADDTLKHKTLSAEGVTSFFVSVEVDPEDRVREVNETNNIADKILYFDKESGNGGDDFPPFDGLMVLLFLIPIIILGFIIYRNNKASSQEYDLMQSTLEELKKSLLLTQTKDAQPPPTLPSPAYLSAPFAQPGSDPRISESDPVAPPPPPASTPPSTHSSTPSSDLPTPPLSPPSTPSSDPPTPPPTPPSTPSSDPPTPPLSPPSTPSSDPPTPPTTPPSTPSSDPPTPEET